MENVESQSSVTQFERNCARANSISEKWTWNQSSTRQNQQSNQSIIGENRLSQIQSQIVYNSIPSLVRQVEELQLKSSLIAQNPTSTHNEPSPSFQRPEDRFDAANVINEQDLNLLADQKPDPYEEYDEWIWFWFEWKRSDFLFWVNLIRSVSCNPPIAFSLIAMLMLMAIGHSIIQRCMYCICVNISV